MINLSSINLSRYNLDFINGQPVIVNNKGKRLKASLCSGGYLMHSLTDDDDKRVWRRLHRIVMDALVANENPDTHIYINHKDHNKINNSLDNLEYVTPKQNLMGAVKAGLLSGSKKRVPVVVINDDGSTNEYKSGRAAGRAIGCSRQTINAALNLRQRSIFGTTPLRKDHYTFADKLTKEIGGDIIDRANLMTSFMRLDLK
ncbi:HNH endonuclease [Vibrio sp. CyArs1]|uniref:HNH endonuclease n=1 Tax=Vibrio sp. CyArs1 TaxID=2682577 RepID=UPI001F06C035|nr:HNH endonuclease [Vibrio sp. CyArs1]